MRARRCSPLALAALFAAPLAACDPEPAEESAIESDTGAEDLAAEDLSAEAARVSSGPTVTARPTVTGGDTVGSVLTASPGTWSGAQPITFAYQWRRCDASGSACTNIAGATSSTYRLTGDDPMHTVRVRVTATNAAGSTRKMSRTIEPTFPAGTVCNASGTAYAPPDRLEHVIVIVFENHDYGSVNGDADAPYFNSIRSQCGESTRYVDNLFPGDINSLSHYLALTSGSNCNTGLGTQGSGCVTDDDGPSRHRLTTRSIFDQVSSWTAYQEDMPSSCNTGNPASGTRYFVKHNPPPYYSSLAGCSAHDVGVPRVPCSGTRNTTCGSPSNAFTDALANDTLAEFVFVTPDIDNDMHDGSVTAGDNWLHTYLPLILSSPAYLRGSTAVYVLWDEQEAFTGGAMPNLFVSPYIRPTTSSTTMNHFAALRAIEDQLGIGTHLGCASGTAPGGGSCPPGSTANLRSVFHF